MIWLVTHRSRTMDGATLVTNDCSTSVVVVRSGLNDGGDGEVRMDLITTSVTICVVPDTDKKWRYGSPKDLNIETALDLHNAMVWI